MPKSTPAYSAEFRQQMSELARTALHRSSSALETHAINRARNGGKSNEWFRRGLLLILVVPHRSGSFLAPRSRIVTYPPIQIAGAPSDH